MPFLQDENQETKPTGNQPAQKPAPSSSNPYQFHTELPEQNVGHSKIWVALLIIIFLMIIAGVSYYSWINYDLNQTEKEISKLESATKTETSKKTSGDESTSATGQTLEEQTDAEISAIDTDYNSASEEDFSETELSDENLGI